MPVLLKLNLQFFSEDIDNNEDNQEDFTGGEDDLLAAIKSLQDSEDDNEEESEDEVTEDETEEDSEEDEDVIEDEEEEEVVDEQPSKKVQSREDNAKFAAQRRQQEVEKRVQAELDRLKQESPEFQLAQKLSAMYGRPVDQIMREMDEAALVKEAEEAKIPVEILRKQRESEERANALEQQLNQIRYENWQSKIKADGEKLKGEYTMLTDSDMDDAVNYILSVARNVDMPLEQAVYALHGKKIVESLAKAKVQDDLAKQSGRSKKTPLAPNNGKASATKTLTAEEQYIAKQFGMSTDDYLKYKS